MWQNKTQKIKAQADAKKREKDRARLHIHIKRITAEIQVFPVETGTAGQTPMIDVRVVLNDLTTEGVGLFSREPMDPGQEILIHFHKPHHLDIMGIVRWCQKHNATSHIISKEPYAYRLGIEFVIATNDTLMAVQKFYENITNSAS